MSNKFKIALCLISLALIPGARAYAVYGGEAGGVVITDPLNSDMNLGGNDITGTGSINITGDITASGMLTVSGEIILSSTPFASFHIASDTSKATVIDTDVFTIIDGTYTLTETQLFSFSNGVLTYEGTVSKHFAVSASMSFTKTAGGSSVGWFRIVKNGEEGNGFLSQVQRSLANTADVGHVSIHENVHLDPGEDIRLLITTGNGDDLTVNNLSVEVLPID